MLITPPATCPQHSVLWLVPFYRTRHRIFPGLPAPRHQSGSSSVLVYQASFQGLVQQNTVRHLAAQSRRSFNVNSLPRVLGKQGTCLTP